MSHGIAALGLVVITLNVAFWIALAVPIGLARWAVPGIRPGARRLLDALYRAAVRVDDFWLTRVVGIRWSMPELAIDPDRTCIVLSNHVSWADVFLLQSLLARQGLVVHFLAKRELLWLPVVGLVLFTFEFPLLRRTTRPGEDDAQRRRSDLEALRKACERARIAPVALACFAEGTRSTASRRERLGSPFRHLLPPRTGGFVALADGLGEQLAGVVDCTLVYGSGSGSNDVSFWDFLAGRVGGIEVHAEWIPRAAVGADREQRARWLAERWADKDALIARRRRLPAGDTIAGARRGPSEDAG